MFEGWVPEFTFYRDAYGGQLGYEAYGAALPAAVRHVLWLTGRPNVRALAYGELISLKRAVCAAVEAFAEWGEGQTGGFDIGEFSVTHYDNRGTTGAEMATDAALKELAGTGLGFTGAGR